MTVRDKEATEAIGRYTAAEVGRLAGVSPRRIGQWSRYGIIPHVSTKPKVYSYADAGEAVLVRYLIEQRLRPRDVRLIVENLRKKYGQWPLGNAPLEHDGRLVVIREGDDVYFDAVEHPGQKIVTGTLLDLKVVREALERGGWVALKSPRKNIQIDPERLSGRPTIRGRRIPTSMVAEMATSKAGRAALREQYDLTNAQIKDARGYEADVAEALVA